MNQLTQQVGEDLWQPWSTGKNKIGSRNLFVSGSLNEIKSSLTKGWIHKLLPILSPKLHCLAHNCLDRAPGAEGPAFGLKHGPGQIISEKLRIAALQFCGAHSLVGDAKLFKSSRALSRIRIVLMSQPQDTTTLKQRLIYLGKEILPKS